jgi:HD-GYP domain-containing protein (c-di-GMP phosphodiesterase class II)
LGWQPDELEALEFAAILHDIGKIGVPEKVLIKTGPLDPDEWEDMRRHPIYGVHMVRGTPYLEDAIPLILHHHERWDGKGYPDVLVGEDIPMGARLLAVADTFHAMTSDRPYRAAIPAEKTYEEILSQSGRQFDPKMVRLPALLEGAAKSCASTSAKGRRSVGPSARSLFQPGNPRLRSIPGPRGWGLARRDPVHERDDGYRQPIKHSRSAGA